MRLTEKEKAWEMPLSEEGGHYCPIYCAFASTKDDKVLCTSSYRHVYTYTPSTHKVATGAFGTHLAHTHEQLCSLGLQSYCNLIHPDLHSHLSSVPKVSFAAGLQSSLGQYPSNSHAEEFGPDLLDSLVYSRGTLPPQAIYTV